MLLEVCPGVSVLGVFSGVPALEGLPGVGRSWGDLPWGCLPWGAFVGCLALCLHLHQTCPQESVPSRGCRCEATYWMPGTCCPGLGTRVSPGL